jgi:hypothetical protein
MSMRRMTTRRKKKEYRVKEIAGQRRAKSWRRARRRRDMMTIAM